MRWLCSILALTTAFGTLRADEADDALAKQLVSVVRDPRLPVASRVEAARSLEKLGIKAGVVVPELTFQLRLLRGTEHEALQEAIVDALGQMGTAARPAMPTLALATNRSVDIDQAIKRTTQLIIGASDAQDVDALARQLASRDASVRLRAAKALGLLGPAAKVATADLLQTLADPDGDVRRAALVALKLVQPDLKPGPAVVKAISIDLRDADPAVRAAAARALGRLGPAAISAAPDLEMLLNDDDPEAKRAGIEALSRVARPQ